MKPRIVNFSRVYLLAGGLAGGAAAVLALVGRGSPAGVCLGLGFMLANLHLIRSLVSRLFRPEANPRLGFVLLTAKLLLMLLLLSGVVLQFPIAPMSFALGATMVLAAMVVEGVFTGNEAPLVTEDPDDPDYCEYEEDPGEPEQQEDGADEADGHGDGGPEGSTCADTHPGRPQSESEDSRS